MTKETQIIRSVHERGVLDEWEIPVAYRVEELYKGTEEPDDPSECTISEHVKVLEDTDPFRKGDLLVLTEDERRGIEENELNEHRDS